MLRLNSITPIYCFILCLFSFQHSKAQVRSSEFNEVAFFDFNQNLKKAYAHAMQMKLKDAKIILQQEKTRSPYNLIPHYIDNYIDFFRVFINGSPRDYKRLIQKKEMRLAKIKVGDKSSPNCRYIQAEIHLQWALVHLKFASNTEALKDLKSAYTLLIDNRKEFPDFILNRKALGTLYMIVGKLPTAIRRSAGLKGTIDQGLREYQSVIRYIQKYPDFEYGQETHILYALLLLHIETEDANAWKHINTTYLDYKSNPMASFILINMSLKTGKSSKALLFLQNLPKGDDYQSFHQFEYLKGLCLLHKMDTKAEVHFRNFLDDYEGTHYLKATYQKLAWLSLINGNTSGYKNYMSKAKTEGASLLACDRLAAYEANQDRVPNVDLLKAEIYFDGGYYDYSLETLTALKESTFSDKEGMLAYNYWMGRISHRSKRFDDAVGYYQKTLSTQKGSTHYYYANAALFEGMIWEYRKNYSKAREAYQACMKTNPSLFKQSIHSQAHKRYYKIRKK
ncbi:MAG: hypothetical protein MK212_02200 [Saprospiraceae bacterium]|nr:hypothetical protein [Saprospiraceae bacterium]